MRKPSSTPAEAMARRSGAGCVLRVRDVDRRKRRSSPESHDVEYRLGKESGNPKGLIRGFPRNGNWIRESGHSIKVTTKIGTAEEVPSNWNRRWSFLSVVITVLGRFRPG